MLHPVSWNGLVLFYPANQVFFQENSLFAYFMGRQSLLYKVVQRLMTDPEEFLRFLKVIENAFHVARSWLFLFRHSSALWYQI